MEGERVLLFCCTVTETPVTAGCSDDRNSEEAVSRSAQVSGWNVGEEKFGEMLPTSSLFMNGSTT